MSFHLVLRLRAEQDVTEAALWYEQRARGLSRRFVEAVEEQFTAIKLRPESFPARHHIYRRALVRHFPFAVFYIIEGDAVVVLTVFHQAQSPDKLRLGLIQ